MNPRSQALLMAHAPAPVAAAWQAMVLNVAAGKASSASDAAATCRDHGVGAETILALQQVTLDEDRTGLGTGLVSRLLGRRQASPIGFDAALRKATVAVLEAIRDPVPVAPIAPEPPEPAEDESKASIVRQANWLVQATHKATAAAGRVSECCGALLEAGAMAFIGINTTADTIEEVSASIESFSLDLARTARASMDASAAADRAAVVIRDLERAAASIGNVTEVIRRIAAQTNMLALNATIEAARAGDAGRGFAVVAKEVKDLARQTAAATESIGSSISDITAGVQGAVRQVDAIQKATSDVHEMASAGAVTVVRQRESVSEMNRAAQDAASAVKQMHEGIEEVATQSFELSTATEELLAGAEVLQVRSGGLADAA